MKYPPSYNDIVLSTEIECSQKEFKAELAKLEAKGISVKSIEPEPIRYKYKIDYYAPRPKEDVASEQWRDIPGRFYGLYQISSLGRIRSIRVKILGSYDNFVLTDGNNKRHRVPIKKMVKEIFG